MYLHNRLAVPYLYNVRISCPIFVQRVNCPIFAQEINFPIFAQGISCLIFAQEISCRIFADCLTVSHSEPGRFTFTSRGEEEVCGLYLVGRFVSNGNIPTCSPRFSVQLSVQVYFDWLILKLLLSLLPCRHISLSWDVYPVPMLSV